MSLDCPKCKRALYNRRVKNCGYCGEAIPEELRFTAEEIAALDNELTQMDAIRIRNAKDREREALARKRAEMVVGMPFMFP